MAKKHDDERDEGHPERVFDRPNDAVEGDRQLIEPAGGFPVLFGNENYVQPKRGRAAREGQPKHTQEEWLVEAQEVEAVLERGDHVSPELILSLFYDALDVIEGYVPPASRSKKEKEENEREKKAS